MPGTPADSFPTSLLLSMDHPLNLIPPPPGVHFHPTSWETKLSAKLCCFIVLPTSGPGVTLIFKYPVGEGNYASTEVNPIDTFDECYQFPMVEPPSEAWTYPWKGARSKLANGVVCVMHERKCIAQYPLTALKSKRSIAMECNSRPAEEELKGLPNATDEELKRTMQAVREFAPGLVPLPYNSSQDAESKNVARVRVQSVGILIEASIFISSCNGVQANRYDHYKSGTYMSKLEKLVRIRFLRTQKWYRQAQKVLQMRKGSIASEETCLQILARFCKSIVSAVNAEELYKRNPL